MSTSSTTIAIVVALAILWLTLFPRVVGSTSPIAASETTLDGNRTDEDVLSSYLAGVQFSEVSWNLDFTEPNMPLFRFFRTRSPSFIDVSSVQRATIAMMRISTKNQTWVFKPLLYFFLSFHHFQDPSDFSFSQSFKRAKRGGKTSHSSAADDEAGTNSTDVSMENCMQTYKIVFLAMCGLNALLLALIVAVVVWWLWMVFKRPTKNAYTGIDYDADASEDYAGSDYDASEDYDRVWSVASQ